MYAIIVMGLLKADHRRNMRRQNKNLKDFEKSRKI